MQFLTGKRTYLRALELSDLAFLYNLENDTSLWEVSQTQQPFSKEILKRYIENASENIYKAEQLRLAICSIYPGNIIGFVDLFDFNAKNHRAGVGIAISSKYQRHGNAFDALQILEKYAQNFLNIHQLYAEIPEDNLPSIHLFKKMNFEQTGIKKDWLFSKNTYKNVLFFQKTYTL